MSPMSPESEAKRNFRFSMSGARVFEAQRPEIIVEREPRSEYYKIEIFASRVRLLAAWDLSRQGSPSSRTNPRGISTPWDGITKREFVEWPLGQVSCLPWPFVQVILIWSMPGVGRPASQAPGMTK